METFYVFIKNDRVANVAVFASEDQQLAEKIVVENDYDSAVWVGTDKPEMFSSYDGKKFTAPTMDYLRSIGILSLPLPEIVTE
jgi:hypothetical protein